MKLYSARLITLSMSWCFLVQVRSEDKLRDEFNVFFVVLYYSDSSTLGMEIHVVM